MTISWFRSRMGPGLGVVIAALLAVLAGCGDDGGPAARPEGAVVAEEAGCMSCHGAGGAGGVGPAWGDLAGSTVTLEDGSEVVADTEYLRRSIVDPGAQVVEGYSLSMPVVELSDEEVDALVAYIESLGA